MFKDILDDSIEIIKELPHEIGTEAVGQVKGTQKQTNQNQSAQQQAAASAQSQQNFLNDMYGVSEMTPEQIEMKKKQDGKMQINNYKRIQDELRAYRNRKKQEETKYEIGWQEGTEAARDQEEEMQLWEKQQKKAEEKKKKEKMAQAPGGAADRSGEKSGNKG